MNLFSAFESQSGHSAEVRCECFTDFFCQGRRETWHEICGEFSACANLWALADLAVRSLGFSRFSCLNRKLRKSFMPKTSCKADQLTKPSLCTGLGLTKRRGQGTRERRLFLSKVAEKTHESPSSCENAP